MGYDGKDYLKDIFYYDLKEMKWYQPKMVGNEPLGKILFDFFNYFLYSYFFTNIFYLGRTMSASAIHQNIVFVSGKKYLNQK